jgi:hypothetical protein
MRMERKKGKENEEMEGKREKYK